MFISGVFKLLHVRRKKSNGNDINKRTIRTAGYD